MRTKLFFSLLRVTHRLTPPSVLVTPDKDCRRPPCHEVLNLLHSGTNSAEIAPVRRDHPGEPESVMNGRVLGTITPFRRMSPPSHPYHSALIQVGTGLFIFSSFSFIWIPLHASTDIGDSPFKQLALFTRRVLYNPYPGVADLGNLPRAQRSRTSSTGASDHAPSSFSPPTASASCSTAQAARTWSPNGPAASLRPPTRYGLALDGRHVMGPWTMQKKLSRRS